MFLRSLGIKNYRSLEQVELNRLGDFNVLIGRNNSGKSAVFGALMLLNDAMHGRSIDWDSSLTSRDLTRILELRLLFEPRPQDRDKFIDIVGPQLDEDRQAGINKSPFFRQVEFLFQTGGTGGPLELRNIKLLSEDGHWANIMGVNSGNNPKIKAVDLRSTANNAKLLEFHVLDIEQSRSFMDFKLPANFMASFSQEPIEPLRWILWRLGRYLGRAFFFNPFRHSTARLPAEQTETLNQDGSNLAQVLHTINSNNRPLFARIEQFLQAALPDVGGLQTPLVGAQTEISFLSPEGNYPVRLHDMGGGIEQLLMVATVLLTTDEESTIFLEEPESHLHAGAQRFLNEKLYEEERQVFISTHSPTFVNSPHSRKIFQIKKNDGKTSISYLSNTDLLSEALDDIGSRNSDVLLSDAVLFVEGPGDQRVFEIWSEKLGMSLEEHNITVVPMGGGNGAVRGTRARSDVLEGISHKSPVPHLFVLDRDERSKSELSKLQGELSQRVYLLERRELENYLLAPRALLAAIRSKHADNATIIENLDAASVQDIDNFILLKAATLKDLVLVKHIRAELAGLKDGLLPRESITGLVDKVNHKNFSQKVRREIETRVAKHLIDLNIAHIVQEEKKSLKGFGPKTWLQHAPGEEIIAEVFHRFGSEYKKPNDTIRIAREMMADEIVDEISNLLRRIVALSIRIGVN
jgi:hypothetical protein